MISKWQDFFIDRVKSTPFVPLTRRDMEYCVTLEAHTSLEKYIHFYCHEGAGCFWTVISMIFNPKTIVEFGTANGATTNLLAKLNPSAIIYSIDHIGWAGTADSATGFLAKANENVNLIMENSREFECKDVGLCFIDADHSKESVLSDSRRAWKNRNVKGDWCIIWDDYDWESVKEAVDQFVSEVKWELQFTGKSPIIGTKAMDEFNNLVKERRTT